MTKKKLPLLYNEPRTFKFEREINIITYPTNFISTCKYSFYDFFPRALLL